MIFVASKFSMNIPLRVSLMALCLTTLSYSSTFAQRRDGFNQTDTSGLLSRWELDDAHRNSTFRFVAYKPVYFLPVNWTSDRNVMPQSENPNNTVMDSLPLQATELKFQLSFKTKIAHGLFWGHGDIWGAYTQTSRWQLYNGETSRPFRETNYEPEVMLVFATPYKILGLDGRFVGAGIAHQSNGRSQPLSRSWNRIIFQLGWEKGPWMIVARPWFRIQEPGAVDDNPHIEDYMGRGDLMIAYNRKGHQFSFIGRHSLRFGENNRGSAEIDWAMPIKGNLKGHLQIFSGYGESMIDYNHFQTTIGFGLSLSEW